MKTLEKFVFDLTHKQMERLIYHTAGKFWRAYGGDFEELHSRAMEAFVDAYQSYVPEKGAMTTWLVVKIYQYLFHYRRRERKYCPLYQNEVYYTRINRKDHYKDRYFSWDDYIDGFDPDSQDVLRLLAEPNQRIVDGIKELGLPTPNNVRKATKEYLLNSGWSKNRVRQAFRQIWRSVHERE